MIASALGMFLLAYLVSPKPTPALSENAAGAPKITFAQVQLIMENRCTSCHAEKPTNEAFPTPPKGVILTSYDQIKANLGASGTSGLLEPLGPLAIVDWTEWAQKRYFSTGINMVKFHRTAVLVPPFGLEF